MADEEYQKNRKEALEKMQEQEKRVLKEFTEITNKKFCYSDGLLSSRCEHVMHIQESMRSICEEIRMTDEEKGKYLESRKEALKILLDRQMSLLSEKGADRLSDELAELQELIKTLHQEIKSLEGGKFLNIWENS